MKFQTKHISIKVNKDKFYSRYYNLINGILKLSSRELSILIHISNHIAQLLSIGYDLPSATVYSLSTISRIKLSDTLGISRFNLNNYIKSLKDKNIFISKDEGTEINSNIFIDINKIDEFEFNIKLKIDN